MKNKCNYILSFREVASVLETYTQSLYNPDYFEDYPRHKVSFNIIQLCIKAFGWTLQANSGFANYPIFERTTIAWQLTSNASKVIQGVINQYLEDNMAISKSDEQEEVTKVCISSFEDFLNILNMSYPKYNALLNIYDNQTSNLLNKVESIESGTNSSEGSVSSSGSSSGSGTSVNKFKDTPQSAINVESDDNYNTNVEVNTNSTETSSEDSSESTLEEAREITRSDDRDTLMKRIDEIQQSYQKVLERWIKEFEPLFWREI